MKHQSNTPRKLPIINRNCEFCDNGNNPDYKDVITLQRHLSERGKIITRSRTGLCSTHQRLLKTQILRSRFIGLLPFVARA